MGLLNIDRKLFRTTGLAGLLGLGITIAIMLYTTSAYGITLNLNLPLNLPNMGYGGFVVESDIINGSGCMLYPVIQDANSADKGKESHLMIRITMDDVSIEGMKITKVIPIPEQLLSAVGASGFDSYKITISAGNAPITIKGLTMDNSSMKCNLAELGLFEQNSSGVIKAISMKITDATIIAHHMEAKSITIPFMKMGIELCDSKGG